MDKLRLSDAAIGALTGGKLNNRLVNDMLAHPDFPELMAPLEVFVDRTISENMEAVNAICKAALNKLVVELV